jgi:hypothetical protein
MSETIKVVRLFIGNGDFRSQNELAKKRKKQGWFVARGTHSTNYRKAMDQAEGSIVIINGARARACVPFAAAEAIARNAKLVIAPLHLMKNAHETKHPFRDRARVFIPIFDFFSNIDTPRLLVTPKNIFEAEIQAYKAKTKRNRIKRYRFSEK